MRFLYVNLNYCKADQKLFHQTVGELNINLASTNEQYTNLNLPGWKNHTTATLVIGSAIWQVLQDKLSFQNGGIVRANVSGITVYSCYIPL